ncbi:MAG: electron transfer flavoprotein [Slackia sp.]
MKIVVSFKVVSDDQDIQVSGDGSLDFSKAHKVVSAYDLNAMEAAAQLAAANEGASVVGVTVGDAKIDDSKLKKNVLARGVDELFMTADDACADMDAHATAAAWRSLGKVGEYDLILCGDGSADNYAQQATFSSRQAGLPVVNGCQNRARRRRCNRRTCSRRRCRDRRGSSAAVISVVPDVALPRIPGMKDILAAGKKPMNVPPPTVLTLQPEVGCKAPEQADRSSRSLTPEDGAIESSPPPSRPRCKEG